MAGFIYVAFVVDVFSRRILGWRVTPTQHTSMVTDALRQALQVRRRGEDTWAPPGSSTVTIELEPADNGTLPRLTHSGLPADVAELHRKGWERYLDRLARRPTGHDPGPDRYID